MQFYDFSFILCFVVIAIIYHIVGSKGKRNLLLIASIAFYWISGWAAALLTITAASVIWLLSRRGERRPSTIALGIVLALLWLAVFKYARDYLNLFQRIGVLSPGSSLISGFSSLQPIGLSFLVFRLVSYLIDIRRGAIQAFRRLDDFLLYAMLFLEAPSGPIERAGQIWPQLQNPTAMNASWIALGVRQIIWGMFKKLIIADTAAILVNETHRHLTFYSGPQLVVAAIYFSIQIYCDFSGYTDMALGYGRILGLRLAPNFNRPYFSETIAEFWRKWHITLSNWLRDYLYLPVNWVFCQLWQSDRIWGVRRDYLIYSVSIFITWIVAGVWHGVGWTFVVWGGLHGGFLVLSNIVRPYKKKFRKRLAQRPALLEMHKSFDRIATFCLVTYAWIFFRAESLSSALLFLQRMFTPSTLSLSMLYTGIEKFDFLIFAGGLALLTIVEGKSAEQGFEYVLGGRRGLGRDVFFLLLALTILFFGNFSTGSFIYFDF
jgi:alginate O-acetyltransferase complex protein AlgI